MYASSGTTLTNAVGGGWQYYDGTLNNAIEDCRIYTPLTPKKEKKMAIDKNKRGLFQVILIDPKEKKMLLDKIVIADNIEDVLLEVDAGAVIKSAGLSVADVDKIVNIIGQVRKTRKNKNGEVEIITEEVKD
jgi:hypothetical protein